MLGPSHQNRNSVQMPRGPGRLLVPEQALLVATLMLGSLLKDSGIVPQLSKSASNELTNHSALLLGLMIGSLMQRS